VSALSTVTVTGIDHDVALSGDRVVMGRLTECDIHLQDANVSREHAAFVAEGAGWVIEDLGSTNGTVLNGKSVSFQRLADGDVIQVGVSELIYHEPRV
jgi:pSer/pThr/pTyr-binding forkhead associated (FHA) protein